jgi:hypothetical protein
MTKSNQIVKSTFRKDTHGYATAQRQAELSIGIKC